MTRAVRGLRPKAPLDRLAQARAVVVVPARNEAEHIGACLQGLAAQTGAAALRPAVLVVVNNSTDGTAEAAERAARAYPRLALAVIDRHIPRGGVGAARRLGFAAAARLAPHACRYLTTDADGIAAPGWIAAMCAAIDRAGLALGRIDVFRHEARAMPSAFQELSRLEADYMRLSLEFARMLQGSGAAGPGLNTAGGANLGFGRAVYRAAGGFRRLPSGEDRDLVGRLIAAGHRPVRVPEAPVRVSLRADGRAPGGMAAKVADRLAGGPAAFDTALAPLDTMLAGHLAAGGRHRPLCPKQARRDLGALRACVTTMRRLPTRQARLAHLERLYTERQATEA